MKRFFYTAYILILLAAFAFSSCGDLISPVDSGNGLVVSTGSTTSENETTANSKARLCVGIGEKAARTILPTDIGESGITKAELLAKASGADSSSTVKEWASDGSESAIAKMSADTEILIDTGTYDFTLNLYATFNGAQTLCQTGTLRAVTVSQGDNPLSFATNYVPTGNGKLSLTLTWAADDRIEVVKAGLFTEESKGETAVTGYDLETLTVSDNSATYEKNEVASGTYIVRFELFGADETKINTLEDVVKIAAACTTTKTLVLKNVNTMYKITYHLNDGRWTDGFTPLISRNANKAVILPTETDITRTGYDFAGWYTAEDFADGTKRAEIAFGNAADVELWAKWTAHEYAITIPETIANGTVTASANTATMGTVITLTLSPESGYEFGTLSVTDSSGSEVSATADESDSTKYTFTMPASDVTVSATFELPIPEGFVKVIGATVSGSVTGGVSSAVFIADRTVEIPNMYVSNHEVTQKEYETYCKYGTVSPNSNYGKGDNYPAYYVNWYDAVVYCNLRSIAEGLTPAYKVGGKTAPSEWNDIVSETTDEVTKYCGPKDSNATWNALTYDTTADGYRLPTEAEWEYIARGGNAGIPETQTKYSGSDTIDDVAWYSLNSSSKTHEVKGKTANSLGIYDMNGNVYEWCYDWYENKISSNMGATGPDSGSQRVIRGGSYSHLASQISVASRGGGSMITRSTYYGFRVVRNAN